MAASKKRPRLETKIIPAGAKPTYKQLERRNAELESKYAQLQREIAPKPTSEELEQRNDLLERRYAQLQRDIAALKPRLDSQKIAALQQRLADAEGAVAHDGEGTPERSRPKVEIKNQRWMKYLDEKGWDESFCIRACMEGDLDTVKYMIANYAPSDFDWYQRFFNCANANEHKHIVKFLVELEDENADDSDEADSDDEDYLDSLL